MYKKFVNHERFKKRKENIKLSIYYTVNMFLKSSTTI